MIAINAVTLALVMTPVLSAPLETKRIPGRSIIETLVTPAIATQEKRFSWSPIGQKNGKNPDAVSIGLF
jgi:hypothetical protein